MSVPSELSPRRLKRLLKDYIKALKADPGNLILRLKIAFVLKELGRVDESIEMYQEVAGAFAAEGRLVQAIAVCKGILEIDPQHSRTQEMLAELVERQRPARRQPALRMRQIDGKWIAIPVPVESGLVTQTTHEEGPGPDQGGTFVEAGEGDDGVTGRRPYEHALPPPEPPGEEADLHDQVTPVPTGETDPGADLEATGRGRRVRGMPAAPFVTSEFGPLAIGEPFEGLAELEPDVDQLPGPPRPGEGALDFPPEAKSHARGAMLLDLPPSASGRYEVLAAPEVEVTRAASPSTLRKQVLREAERLVMDEVTAESPVPALQAEPPDAEADITVRARPPRAQSRPQVEAVDAKQEITDRTVGPGAAEMPAYDEAEASGELFAPEEEAALRALAELQAPPAQAAAGDQVSIPLFSDLPRDAFVELLGKMVVRREAAGSVIVREGEPGDAFFVVTLGSVRVLKRRPDGSEVEVARLGAGAFFGEMALLADQRRHATVVAIEDTELFEISRKVMAELAEAHPAVLDTLRRFHRERLLATLLQTTPLFQPLDESERAQLATRMCIRKCPERHAIVEQGRPTDGLYLILTGGVDVTMHAPGAAGAAEILLGRLGEGSYFGEMSLLRGGVASATVRARVASEVVHLPARDFYHVMAAHPVVWQEIRREAARREAANAALLTGQAGL